MAHTGKFQIYKDKKGEWRWRLVARNGRIVADSAEGYKTKWGAWKAVKTVIEIVKNSKIKMA